MKIVEASNYYIEHVGGIEAAASDLVDALRRRGHIVRWVAADVSRAPHQADDEDPGIRAWNVTEDHLGFPYPLPDPREFRRLVELVRWSDIVHIHDCIYATNIALYLLARRVGRPVVLTQHVREVPYSSPALRTVQQLAFRSLVQPLLRRADAVVFVSDQVRDRFARFVPETRTSVINNGVDLTRFEPGDESPSPDSGRALMPNAPTLLFVGRFVEKKGIDQIRAVARERPDWRWLLIGRGDHEDPSGWGLENVVCRPPVPRSKLASVYRNANLLILPSTGEGLPVVIQEAILSGLGVVTTTDTAAAIPRECSPAVTAWDSRCGPLTEAIQRALERPRVDVDTIAAARRLWGIERVAERYEEIFQAEL